MKKYLCLVLGIVIILAITIWFIFNVGEFVGSSLVNWWLCCSSPAILSLIFILGIYTGIDIVKKKEV